MQPTVAFVVSLIIDFIVVLPHRSVNNMAYVNRKQHHQRNVLMMLYDRGIINQSSRRHSSRVFVVTLFSSRACLFIQQ